MSSSNSIHAAPIHSNLGTNPFSTPSRLSRAPSVDGPSSSSQLHSLIENGTHQPRRRKFRSARLVDGEYDEKPWATAKHPKLKWERAIFYGSVGIGVAVGAIICYMAFASVTNHEYCLVMEDGFTSIDKNIWNFEIQRGGFGSGTFEWTTDDPKNAYTDSEGLHIVPTLTLESTGITMKQMTDDYVLNLTTAGTCTVKGISDCSIRSNKTAGTIINPVRSARLSTKGKKFITYGKVEVVAKMPQGNWLWPAIWMMPERDTYGKWPASGEIDIAESRGQFGDDYPSGGRDNLISALHWGPVPEKDAFYKTLGQHQVRRTDYSQKFHTFGVEWSEDYLFTFIDSRLLVSLTTKDMHSRKLQNLNKAQQVFFIKFSKYRSMWDRGGFGEVTVNHSALYDSWSQTHKSNTPFDHPFYLILNVAVGGTNGFFPDGVGNKRVLSPLSDSYNYPLLTSVLAWGDLSPTAPKEFWNGQNAWLPTWGEGAKRGLTVRSVKMWKQGAC